MKNAAYTAYAPSNIALLKYWGKNDAAKQWPANDSLSVTLTKLGTKTTTRLDPLLTEHSFILSGKKILASDHPKIFSFLKYLCSELQAKSFFSIESDNSFPHSCGIASSASGMAALTISIVAALYDVSSLEELVEIGFTQERLSTLARMGSGSAGRSMWGGFVHWQKGNDPFSQSISQVFSDSHWKLSHRVLLLSTDEKKTSSSEGHKSAWNSPLFGPRLAILPHRLQKMMRSIQERDLQTLGDLVEEEALEMHAVMMTSKPPISYFHPDTPKALTWVRMLREEKHIQVYFTMDAGPNVHLFCSEADSSKLDVALREAFPQFNFLCDVWGGKWELHRTIDQ